MLASIRRRHWNRFNKEVVAGLLGALMLHIWKVRNWRLCKGINTQSSDILGQINKETVGKAEFYSHSNVHIEVEFFGGGYVISYPFSRLDTHCTHPGRCDEMWCS